MARIILAGRCWDRSWVVLVVVAALAMPFASRADTAGGIPTFAEMQREVSFEKAIQDNQLTEFLLKSGGACVLSRTASDANDLGKIMVYLSPTHVYCYCLSEKGRTLSGGGDPVGDGRLRRLSKNPAFAVDIRWLPQDGGMTFQCSVETNQETLTERLPDVFGKRKNRVPQWLREPNPTRTIEAANPEVREYEMGTEMTFVMKDDQAICFVPTNPQRGLEKIYFYYTSKMLFYQNLWKNGDVTGDFRVTNTDEPIISSRTDFKTYGNAPDLAQIVLWDRIPEGIQVTHFFDSGSAEARPRLASAKEKATQLRQKDKERQKRIRVPLQFDDAQPCPEIKILVEDMNSEYLRLLRTRYDLDAVVAEGPDDLGRLAALTHWVHGRWKHNGDNVPSKPDPLTILDEAATGKMFRCVEYASVLAGVARAVGLPSRILSLKRSDVESASGGAGHVVAEVWLPSRKKWVFADAQWDFLPVVEGTPLNAVEFQRAIAEAQASVANASEKSTASQAQYLVWIVPYLAYFDFSLDQRFDPERSEEARIAGPAGGVMLVPAGSGKPSLFQRVHSFRNMICTSNSKAFYAAPEE